jgi:hypothetical protein
MSVMTERERRVGLHLPVDLRGVSVKGAPFTEATRSVNISGGGICFETRQKLLVGHKVTLLIQLPVTLRKHFGGQAVYWARAVVCRVERFEGEAVSRVGARFLGEVEA